MQTGKIVRFDDVRGYGFIAPDQGGEDIFVHANDFREEKHLVQPGVPVEYEAIESDRGLKALTVRIIGRPSASPAVPVHAVHVAPLGGAAPVRSGSDSGDDEVMCDVLTPSQFRQRVTELLLESVPTLTAVQILQLRESLLRFGLHSGWVEEESSATS